VPTTAALPPAFTVQGLFYLGLALVLVSTLHSALLWLGHLAEEGLGRVLAAAVLQGLGLLAHLARPWLGGTAVPGDLLLLTGAGFGLWALRRYAGRPARLDRWGWIALSAWVMVALAFRAMGFAWVRGAVVPAALVVLALGMSRELGRLAWEGVEPTLAQMCAALAALLALAALAAGIAAAAPASGGCAALTRAWFCFWVLALHQFSVLLLAQVQGQRVQARLARLVATDPVTGLFSAEGFRARLDRAVGRSLRTGRLTSLLILELDSYGDLLEAHGPAPLAHILVAFGAALDRTLREADLTARLEGCRFAALLHQTPPQEALLAAERVRAIWADLPLALGARSLRLTLSAGVASTREPIAGSQDLLDLAAARAASARAGGGNNVEGEPGG